MADARWHKLRRDAWSNRGRFALAIVALAVALAAAGTIAVTRALVARATHDGFVASLPASATIEVAPLDTGFVERVRGLPGIAAARARRTLAISLRIDGASRPALLFAPFEYEATDLGRLAPDGGTWPPRDGGLVVERSSVDFAGARMGESAVAGDDAPLAIAGFARDVSLAPGWMEHLVYGFATPATLARIGGDRARDELRIRASDASADRDAVRRLAQSVQALALAEGRRVSRIEVPEPGQHVHAAQMDSLLLTQAAFAAIALLAAGFLVLNLMASILAGQVREIGVMKAIGGGDLQVALPALGQAALLGVAATAIALPIALAAGRRYAAFKGELLNFPMDAMAMPVSAWLPLLLVGLALPVLAAAWPVRRAVSQPPAEALRDSGIASDAGRIARRWRLPWLGRPLTIALNNAFRRRARFALTLLSLVAAGAAFLAAANLRGAVIASIDELFAAQHFDATLALGEGTAAADVERIASRVPGVARTEAWGRARAALVQADGLRGDEFTVLAVPRESILLTPQPLAGRWLGDGDGEIVVSRRLARENPAMVTGARVTLALDGIEREWRVVGQLEAGPQATAWIARGTAPARVLAVAFGPGGEAVELGALARLRSSLADAGISAGGSQRIAEAKRVVGDHLLMVVDFLAAMGWTMLVVGALGLGSTMALAVLERTREIGVLRAIGAGDGQVAALVQAESLVIALLAWLIAIPASIPVALALGAAFGRIMFTVPARPMPDGGAVLAWLATSVGIAVVAAALPALRAVRLPPVRALIG